MITISRPAHKRYALASLDDASYAKFVNGYALAKKCGVRGVWLYISGSGYIDLCKEILKGSVRRWGRRKLATGFLSFAAWSAAPLVPLITNSTKIIKLANATHTCVAFVGECIDDCTGAAWLPLDIAICGQPIPMGEAGRFNVMGGDSLALYSSG